MSSSLKPTSTPRATRESRNDASNFDQSVVNRFATATTNMMIGTKIGHLWSDRRRSNNAGRHHPSTVVRITRSAAPTARSITAPRHVDSAEVPISVNGTPLRSDTPKITTT